MWRQILQTGLADRWNLRQVTLGGEIADQQILDSLAAHFPDARISHVFASTETAAAFAVHDGIAGFPTSQLIENPAGIRMRIRDGILEIHNPFSSNADEDGFVTTGDEVVEENGRVLFLGRRSGVANSGGTKVWPEQVENQLRRHPAVADALVNAKRNPFTGSVLVAAVTLAPGEDCDGLSLRKWLKQRLPSTHVPATITVVDALETNPTGKVLR